MTEQQEQKYIEERRYQQMLDRDRFDDRDPEEDDDEYDVGEITDFDA